MKKVRLDQLVFDLGYTESRERAKTTIMSGLVFVNGQRADKPGTPVSPDAKIEVHGEALPFVSRGGFKLDKALKVFPIDPAGKTCIDCGASTGGFTDVLLQHGSKKVYADISSELLISIFFPKNPLHDGGVIIQGDRITSAGAVFPVSTDTNISKRLGTRHRAALGISAETDAIAIIVSEETGRISIAINNELHYNLSTDDARMLILDELRPKKETIIEEDEDIEEETLDDEII